MDYLSAVCYSGLGVVAAGSPFPGGDIGWVGNLAPGDTFYLGANDMVLYRIYAGEPFIDVNGNGIWDQPSGAPGVPNTNPLAINNEPFNDVDGNGTYTPPNPATIDTDSGMFIGQPLGSWPQVGWNSIRPISPTPLLTRSLRQWPCTLLVVKSTPAESSLYTPIAFIRRKHLSDIETVEICRCSPPKSIVTKPASYAFSFNRRPLPLLTPEVGLPSGVVIDMGVNFLPAGSTNIVAAPGSGLDMVVAAAPGQGYLGNFATFRAHPICDPSINTAPSTTAAARFNRSIIITFDPSGVVDRVYSWDERQFTPRHDGNCLRHPELLRIPRPPGDEPDLLLDWQPRVGWGRSRGDGATAERFRANQPCVQHAGSDQPVDRDPAAHRDDHNHGECRA